MVFLLKATEMPSLNYGEAQLHVATNEEQPSDGKSRTIYQRHIITHHYMPLYISQLLYQMFMVCVCK